MSSRPIRNTTAPDRYGNPINTEAAVGGLNVADLIMPGANSLELDQARIRWEDPELTRENAKSKQDFELIQALAACAAFAVAAPVVPPAVPRSDVIEISSDEEQEDAAVAQSPQAPRSSPKIGAKRAPVVTLQAFGRRSNADKYKPGASGEQVVQDDSQEIIVPSSSQDASESDSQSSVRADWNSPNSGNGTAATADDANDVPVVAGVKRKADDANDVPVFGGNGGNGAGRTFAVQPDGSALRTDTDANGTQQTSRWKLTAHGQWQKHDKNNV